VKVISAASGSWEEVACIALHTEVATAKAY